MPVKLELYTGPHCELCNHAKELVYKTLPNGSYELTSIDVTGSVETKKAYGLRIPVLRNVELSRELEWPFNAEQLQDLMSAK